MLKFKTYSFETLDVWKEIRILSKIIYNATNSFPREEKFGLVSQMRRAVISISSNIAEGSSRKSLKDQARYTELSFGSLMELLSQAILSHDINLVSEIQIAEIRMHVDQVGFLLDGLKKSQLKRFNEQKNNNSKHTP
ncbi:MAG: four helix bundle protein [Saprospiraceae bacterium]|uniref:Four helix bundle protein n=1 Tax=Candidatus Opimibacter skivensis TaxID=2982028 RepID=A0A9D7SWI1_9BACT|nr:four helix bundle protein [Candidatus Opimibacter skivensis]